MPRSSPRAWTPAVHVIVITGAGEKFFCAGANIGMLKDADPDLQVLLLPARQRDAQPSRTDAEAGDRRAQWPHRRRRPRGGDGRRHPHRAAGRRQDRHARGGARRAARHRRHAAIRAAGRQGQGDRADGDGHRCSRSRTRTAIGLVNHVWGEARLERPHVSRRPCRTTRSSSRRPTRPRRPSATSSAPCSPASNRASRRPRARARAAAAAVRERRCEGRPAAPISRSGSRTSAAVETPDRSGLTATWTTE